MGNGIDLDGGRNVSVAEIVADEEERFARGFGQCISEAVAETQLGWMAPAFPKVAIGFARYASVLSRDRLDDNAGLLHQLIEVPTRDAATVGVDDDSSFEEVGSGNTSQLGLPNRPRAGVAVGLIA